MPPTQLLDRHSSASRRKPIVCVGGDSKNRSIRSAEKKFRKIRIETLDLPPVGIFTIGGSVHARPSVQHGPTGAPPATMRAAYPAGAANRLTDCHFRHFFVKHKRYGKSIVKLPAIFVRHAVAWLIPFLVLIASASGAAYACPPHAGAMQDGVATAQITACADDHQPAACANHCASAQRVTAHDASFAESGDAPPALPAVKIAAGPTIVLRTDAPVWHVSTPAHPPLPTYLLTARLRI
ncbi:hypothetical protein [Pandoraea anhela]|uniref:Uncharacterized protein n=1 Tax=Pandoraea anhela TaxID=2508295 RepID=A0A5E4VXE9_9BURK|nr:hypothetical protein [Pandoraea anhela]VVE16851.1 hypothetical protein PAN31108_02916 [Pandoraea anhela]